MQAAVKAEEYTRLPDTQRLHLCISRRAVETYRSSSIPTALFKELDSVSRIRQVGTRMTYLLDIHYIYHNFQFLDYF